MNEYKMNNSSELNSLLIATTVFAIGGLGLFMYNSEKSSSKRKYDNDDDDESRSDSGSDSDLSLKDEEFDTLDNEDVQDTDAPQASLKKGQTKRKSPASSKTKKRR